MNKVLVGVVLGTLLMGGCASTTASSTASEQVCAALDKAQGALAQAGEQAQESAGDAVSQLEQARSDVQAAKDEATGATQAVLVGVLAKINGALDSAKSSDAAKAAPENVKKAIDGVNSSLETITKNAKCA